MGKSFGRQISPVDHHQLYWLPRAKDQNGGGEQGGILAAQFYYEVPLFVDLAITDTSTHDSDLPSEHNTNPTGNPFDQVYGVYKTAILISTLDQSLTVQPTFSRDGKTFYPFGNTDTLPAANGSTPGTLVFSLTGSSMYVPYVGLQVTAATAPTTGTINGWLEQLG